MLTVLHLLSVVWGIAVEVSPWPCPLTTLEQRLEHMTDTITYMRDAWHIILTNWFIRIFRRPCWWALRFRCACSVWAS
ncbi:MAG: DUF2784 family protein, partial [Blastocatellia bacterium]|nr:DUF2784 family protein [Blastocatellia bacterium]